MPPTTSTSPRRSRRLVGFGIIAAAVAGSSVFQLLRIDPPGTHELAVEAAPPPVATRARAALSALDPSAFNFAGRQRGTGEPREMELVENIIADPNLSLRQKADHLLGEVDQLSGEAAVAACEFALLCLDGEAYEPAFEKLIAVTTEIGIQQAIMADLMDRPAPLRLPLLVRLASLADHPFSDEARVELVAELGADYGSNWSGWSDGVANHLELSSGTLGFGVLQQPPAASLTD